MQMKAVDLGTKTLHPHHIRLLRLREAASRLAIECGDWQLAERLITGLVTTYRVVYPQGWPILGVQVGGVCARMCV